jgi:hypothetical protein
MGEENEETKENRRVDEEMENGQDSTQLSLN